MSLAHTMETIPQQRWLRIIPPVVLVYIFSNMDRANIGVTMAGGMNEALGMTAAIAGLAAGIFSVGYLVLQIPGGHVAARYSAKKYITGAILAFGLVASCTGFVTSSWQLVALRFILGVAEGGTFPAILVLISNWFPNEERARANGFFIMSNSLAYIITGPLSGWIVSTFGWRHVFFIEGGLTVLLVLAWWPLIEDRPEHARWLSAAERDYLVSRLKEEQGRVETGRSYREILSNRNLWKLAAIYFCYQSGIASFGIWLPTIIRTLTKSGMTAVGFLSGAPFLAAMIGVYIFAARSDRTGNRRLYAGLPGLGFAVCLVLSTQFQSMIWVSYAFLICCGFFQQAHIGAFWSIPPLLFPKEIAGGARGIVNGIGNLGGFMGVYVFGLFVTHLHSANMGRYALSFFLLMAFLLSFTLPSSLSGKGTMRGESGREPAARA